MTPSPAIQPQKRTLKRSKLRPQSKRRQTERREYNKLVARLLAERPICECWLEENGWTQVGYSKEAKQAFYVKNATGDPYFERYLFFKGAHRATQCHHMKGRGRYYLDYSTFKAVGDYYHRWIEDHKDQAIAKGWLSADKLRRPLNLPPPAPTRIK